MESISFKVRKPSAEITSQPLSNLHNCVLMGQRHSSKDKQTGLEYNEKQNFGSGDAFDASPKVVQGVIAPTGEQYKINVFCGRHFKATITIGSDELVVLTSSTWLVLGCTITKGEETTAFPEAFVSAGLFLNAAMVKIGLLAADMCNDPVEGVLAFYKFLTEQNLPMDLIALYVPFYKPSQVTGVQIGVGLALELETMVLAGNKIALNDFKE